MPLSSQIQDDFGSGIFRGRKAPANSVYDLVNGLIDDEGLIYRRGGSAYYSASDASEALTGVFVAYLRAVAGNRVLLTGANNRYVLDGSNAPILVDFAEIRSRLAAVSDYVAFTTGTDNIVLYAGSRKTSQYITGTVSVTAGSKTVTGAGTSWSANADSGMILYVGGTTAIVRSVDSNTQITLLDPWAGSTAAGSAYELNISGGTTWPGLGTTRRFVAAAGSGSPRLLYCVGNRVYFTERGDPTAFDDANYHELPANAIIVGAEGRGDSALIFTTAGIWEIGNLSFDAIDSFGNIQHTVEQVNKDVILWDDFGIAGSPAGLVIPTIEDVLVMGSDGLQSITDRIRPPYRSYVKAGYQPGQAAVHRGHYILPILNGTSLVDVLVCRLDRGAAWTTWAGGAASVSYATLIAETSRQPKLLGLKGARVTDLTGCFDPAAATDADGTTSDMVIVSRDYPTGVNQPGFAAKVRARYELEGAATVTPAFSSDQDDDVYANLTDRGEQDGGTGWAASDGSKYQWGIVGKRRDRIRFKLTVAGACSRFVLRSIEILTRPSGRQ